MKERNILRRVAGWVVGLDDENEIVVEAPTGERGLPTEGRSNVWVIYATGTSSATHNADDLAVQIPDAVMHYVRIAAERRGKAFYAASREAQGPEPEREERASAPTLAELGFTDNPRVDS